MPRYVILRHSFPSGHARRSHWDLMLQWGDCLRTWALEREPAAGTEIEAEQLTDHREAYLDYEGEVSGDRGSVTRWDAGEYRVEGEADDGLRVTLLGGQLPGGLTLTRQAPEGHFWRASFAAAPTSG